MILGEGGMAVVYKVWQPELERWVAVKKCKNPQDLPAFHKEAKLMAALKHPRLAQIHALNHDELTMEYIEGQTLRDTTIDSHLLLEQLLEVLEYLHGQEIILKDLKPENIMIQPDQTIKVLDLGIAKRVHEGTQLLLKGVGSEFYSPPEQYGHGVTDQRSDFYSLGATLYFAETRQDPPPAWERLSKGTPLNTTNPLIHQLTQLKPEDRPESVNAIRQILRPIPKKERPRPSAPEITQRTVHLDHGLLAYSDEGLWVANTTLHLLNQPPIHKTLTPVKLKAHKNKLALATKDRLYVKTNTWSEHKISLKDFALTNQDILILTNHLELQQKKTRFPTGWGKRYTVCAADDTHVAAGDKTHLKVWDIGGSLLWEDHQPAQTLQFHGPFLFSTQPHQITIYQSDSGQHLSQIQTEKLQQIHFTDRHLIGIHENGVTLWDYAQNQRLLHIETDRIISSAYKDQLAISTPDKIWVLSLQESSPR